MFACVFRGSSFEKCLALGGLPWVHGGKAVLRLWYSETLIFHKCKGCFAEVAHQRIEVMHVLVDLLIMETQGRYTLF